jgi:hypothetical protein
MSKMTTQEYQDLIRRIQEKPRQLVEKARNCGGCQKRREAMARGLHRLSNWFNPGE